MRGKVDGEARLRYIWSTTDYSNRYQSERTEAYLALVRATMQTLADQGKLRDLDIAIATKHIIQTIAGIARWHSKDSEISEDNLIAQTVNYCMSAILKR